MKSGHNFPYFWDLRSKSSSHIQKNFSSTKKSIKTQSTDPNGNNDSGYAPSNLEDTIREHVSPPGSPGMKDATVLKNMACDSGKWKKNGKTTKVMSDSRSVLQKCLNNNN